MKVIITPQTQMKFSMDLTYLKIGDSGRMVCEDFTMNFDTLDQAREYADWAENNSCRVEQMTLELES